MARLMSGARVRVTLPSGDAFLILREPTNEELNAYQARKFNMPDQATPEEASLHAKNITADFFDLLLTGIEDLEDAEGVITLDRKAAIPQAWKVEAVFRRWDRTPVSLDEKN
jgi:hypothetical protein